MPSAHKDSGHTVLAKRVAKESGASKRVVARSVLDGRLLLTMLLLLGAASSRTSSRVMAFSEVSQGSAATSAQQATLTSASSTSLDIPFADYDTAAEGILLDLANQERTRAALPSLTLDPGLSQAARAHARTMLAQQELSHQFTGELPLPQRLAAATRLQLDQEGENVAFDSDASAGHRHLMLSPPHRANLLNAAYNVVGLGVVRDGGRLYIVQDFGHALPYYSLSEMKTRIAATVMQARHQANQPNLIRRDLPIADDAACSMAREDKVGTSSTHQLSQRYTVVTYTTLQPETLPAVASPAVANHNLRSFSIGACYAHTDTYPTGVYWVVLSLE